MISEQRFHEFLIQIWNWLPWLRRAELSEADYKLLILTVR